MKRVDDEAEDGTDEVVKVEETGVDGARPSKSSSSGTIVEIRSKPPNVFSSAVDARTESVLFGASGSPGQSSGQISAVSKASQMPLPQRNCSYSRLRRVGSRAVLAKETGRRRSITKIKKTRRMNVEEILRVNMLRTITIFPLCFSRRQGWQFLFIKFVMVYAPVF